MADENFVTRDEFMAWSDKWSDRIDDKFEKMDDKFDDLVEVVSKAMGRIGVAEASKGTIPLGAIALIFGVIISIGSVIGALTIVPLAVAQDRHAALEGHPKTMMKLATEGERLDRAFGDIRKNTSSIVDLDANSQREMRLLDGELKAQFSSQIDSIENRLSNTETWVISHDQLVAPLNASQWAEIHNNTKEIDRIRSHNKNQHP